MAAASSPRRMSKDVSEETSYIATPSVSREPTGDPALPTTTEQTQPAHLGLLQVTVHGLGDVGSVDGIVVGVLTAIVLLNHHWRETTTRLQMPCPKAMILNTHLRAEFMYSSHIFYMSGTNTHSYVTDQNALYLEICEA